MIIIKENREKSYELMVQYQLDPCKLVNSTEGGEEESKPCDPSPCPILNPHHRWKAGKFKN